MGELRANIIGYHVNDEERCKKFISDEDYLIYSKDTMWLGFGMYFWDNNANADYWISQTKRKKPKTKKIAKVMCNIYIDSLLDLTDNDTLNTFEELWQEYCKKEKCEVSEKLGIKLDRIFDFFEVIDNTFKVVKVYGKYEKTPTRKFIDSNYLGKRIGTNDFPTHKVKCIYSVRDMNYIINRRLVEVVENEKYKGG